MKDEELLEQILSELKLLNNNFKELFEQIKSTQKPASKKNPKVKLQPLTEEEIKIHRNKFNDLYQDWINGLESKVRNELENYSPDDIRRFGDANNLNVTTRMSKDKVIHLISVRFREKKLLSQNMNITKSLSEQLEKKDDSSKSGDET